MEAVRVEQDLTVRQIRQSGLIGLWKNRDDIEDSAAYARRLRGQAQSRGDIHYEFAHSTCSQQ